MLELDSPEARRDCGIRRRTCIVRWLKVFQKALTIVSNGFSDSLAEKQMTRASPTLTLA